MPSVRLHGVRCVCAAGVVLLAGCNIASPPQPATRDKDSRQASHWFAEVGWGLTEGIWRMEALDPEVVVPDVEAQSAGALEAAGVAAHDELTMTALAGVRIEVLGADPSIVSLRVPGVSGAQLQAALRPRFEGRQGGVAPSTVERLAVDDRLVDVYHYPTIHQILAVVPDGDTLYSISDRTDAGWQRGVRMLPAPTPSPQPTPLPRPWVWLPPRPTSPP